MSLPQGCSEDSFVVLQYSHFLAQEKVVLSALSLSSAALWEPTKWEVVPEPCRAAEEETGKPVAGFKMAFQSVKAMPKWKTKDRYDTPEMLYEP